MKEKNDDVAEIERIRNELNVSTIIAIDYNDLEKICKQNNLQLFVFQYDNVSAQITIVIAISNKNNQIREISFKYHNYANVFDEIDANNLFEHKSYDHAIETKNRIFSFDFVYDLFITKFEAFRKYLNDNFKRKSIVFFSSFADAFIMFVKKNENLRLCVTYKNLNSTIVKNRYFILLIKPLLNRLIETAIFTKLNIRSVYNALRIRINDK